MSSKIFFMEIFNEILKVNGKEIMVVYDISGTIWFKFKDILKILGYTAKINRLKEFNINKNNITNYDKINILLTSNKPENMQRKSKFINESGLYELLTVAKKPIAKIFMDKYFSEIMPEIRKNGQYKLNETDRNKLIRINKNLEKDKLILINNQRNIIYPIGYALYIITRVVHNKKHYKLGFTSNLNKRLKVYNTSSPNKFFYNFYIMVNNNQIDTCIKKILKNDEYIKNKEYYLIKLKRILKFINSCDPTLNKICCGYCLKCYTFEKIHYHKCKYIN